jgi:hypothetical protein
MASMRRLRFDTSRRFFAKDNLEPAACTVGPGQGFPAGTNDRRFLGAGKLALSRPGLGLVLNGVASSHGPPAGRRPP